MSKGKGNNKGNGKKSNGKRSDRYHYSNEGKIKKDFYEKELSRLQNELVNLQYWVKSQDLRVLLIFEGRGGAGKGGVIKRIVEPLNPRDCRIVALAKPSDRERTQWYFQRYVSHLPAAGEMVIFDRSWYNRSGVEKVMGFCTDAEYREFLRSCPEFERMLVRSGIIVRKYWFSVAKRSRRSVFRSAPTIRSSVGSSVTWTWSSAISGSISPKPKTRPSSTPTSRRLVGMSCSQMTNARRA